MGTAHKYGYLYPLGLASKLQKTQHEMADALKRDRDLTPEQFQEFERDYWHAMRQFACCPAAPALGW